MSTLLHATTYATFNLFITGARNFDPWMTTPNKRISLVAITLVTVVMSGNSVGQKLDIEAVLAPVIGLEARVPEYARSVQTLGAVRGGTGVVIDGVGPEYSCCLGKVVMMESLDGRKLDYMVRFG